MDYRHQHPTWVEVDLGAVRTNVRAALSLTEARIMAVVKADGYGHGALPVARAALQAGASWCGVARLEEALELRQGGIQAPILILGPAPPAELGGAIAQGVSLTVFSEAQIAQAAAAARQAGSVARLHLKLDTGMGRLGARPEQAADLAASIGRDQATRLEGVFTHFANADAADPAPTERQLAAFSAALQLAGLRDRGEIIRHAANSAAALCHPKSHFDMVRIGIALYGLHPSADCPLPAAFRPALEWKTQVTQVKLLPPGSGVSYGHTYLTRREERIGTIPVGYADGWRRTEGNQVLVGGRPAPVIGRVCMDQSMLQLDHLSSAQAGDEVVLIGSQGEARITAEELAGRWGTINYEVTCGISRRVPRLYPGS